MHSNLTQEPGGFMSNSTERTLSARPRVAVAGAGALGLACAFELVRRGAQVVVLEAGIAGSGAVRASGGMLAAGFETSVEADDALSDPGFRTFAVLMNRASGEWPDFAAALSAAGGEACGHERRGSITPAFRRADLARLETAARRAEALGLAVERLDAKAAATAEPALAPCLAALRFPDDGQVDARNFASAALAACRALGVEVREQSPVSRIEPDGAGWKLWIGSEAVLADAVMIASGAAARIAGLPQAAAMTPVHGQMLAFAPQDAQAAPLRGVLRAFDIYACRKPDGRLLAGATSEPGRADLGVDADALDRLLEAARGALPGLRGADPVDHWAGLRPASPDRRPVVGAVEDGLVLALGGYRNGVLLAPVLAQLAADAALGGLEVPAAVSPQRFARG